MRRIPAIFLAALVAPAVSAQGSIRNYVDADLDWFRSGQPPCSGSPTLHAVTALLGRRLPLQEDSRARYLRLPLEAVRDRIDAPMSLSKHTLSSNQASSLAIVTQNFVDNMEIPVWIGAVTDVVTGASVLPADGMTTDRWTAVATSESNARAVPVRTWAMMMAGGGGIEKIVTLNRDDRGGVIANLAVFHSVDTGTQKLTALLGQCAFHTDIQISVIDCANNKGDNTTFTVTSRSEGGKALWKETIYYANGELGGTTWILEGQDQAHYYFRQDSLNYRASLNAPPTLMRFNLFTDELALLGRNSLEFVVTPENRLRCSASSKAVDTAADFIVIER